MKDARTEKGAVKDGQLKAIHSFATGNACSG